MAAHKKDSEGRSAPLLLAVVFFHYKAHFWGSSNYCMGIFQYSGYDIFGTLVFKSLLPIK